MVNSTTSYTVRFVFCGLLAGLIVGCATSSLQTRITERPKQYAALPPDQRAAVDEGRIKVGMSPDAVYLAWGAPADVIESETRQGHSTVWVYHGQTVEEYRYWVGRRLESDYYPRNFVRAEVVFENGLVSSWRTFPKPE